MRQSNECGGERSGKERIHVERRYISSMTVFRLGMMPNDLVEQSGVGAGPVSGGLDCFFNGSIPPLNASAWQIRGSLCAEHLSNPCN